MNENNTEKITVKEKFRRMRADFKSGILFFFKNTPILCYIFWGLSLICLICHLISLNSVAFADFMVRYPNAAFRFIIAKITSPISFSITEMILMLLPAILFFLIFTGVRIARKGTNRQYVRMIAVLLAILSYFYSSFVLTLAPGYQGTTLDKKLALSREKLSAEDLSATALWLNDRIGQVIDQVDFLPGSFSVMPYDLSVMNDKLNDAYQIAAEKYDFISPLKSRIKPIILSEPMSYTHITGVYTFFTGESNLNVNFPDYTLPYTAAHEFAHQRGTAMENEANFVAFLVSMESEDPYILYSAYVNMLEYVMNALYSASSKAYNEVYTKFDSRLVGEFYAYADFYAKYRTNKVADVSNAVNNTYLQTQGVQAGTKSYGLVVDLMAAYYKDQLRESE